jgi:aminoglycoside phosphotransferase (APT) family kinase protein
MVDTLAEIHRVDHAAAGLHDFGRPSRDVEGHLRRFARIIEPQQPGLSGELGAVLERLLDDPPAPREATVMHGDYRLGNLMLAPHGPPQILAVLDWELATIGDPLRDLGYFLATYAVPGEPLHALTALSSATLAHGFPSRRDLAERYAHTTRRDLSRLDWYLAMALWKLAVLFTYQHRRVGQGIGDPYYLRPELADEFLATARDIMIGASA